MGCKVLHQLGLRHLLILIGKRKPHIILIDLKCLKCYRPDSLADLFGDGKKGKKKKQKDTSESDQDSSEPEKKKKKKSKKKSDKKKKVLSKQFLSILNITLIFMF